jgi:hypothetical protein
MREPNILLDALIDEAGMSHDGFASRVNQAGGRHGLVLLYDHASVRRWIRDATVPRGRVPELICEVLSMRLGRTVTLPDAGLDRGAAEGDGTPLEKAVDAATALWRSDFKQAAALHSAQPLQGPAAIAPVFEWENPPDDLDVARQAGKRVGAEQVRVLQAARLRYERMYREAGGIPVRPRIVEFLAEHAVPLVRGPTTTRPAGTFTEPPEGWRRWPGSAPTTATCRGSPSGTSFRRCAWRPGTGGSAGT